MRCYNRIAARPVQREGMRNSLQPPFCETLLRHRYGQSCMECQSESCGPKMRSMRPERTDQACLDAFLRGVERRASRWRTLHGWARRRLDMSRTLQRFAALNATKPPQSGHYSSGALSKTDCDFHAAAIHAALDGLAAPRDQIGGGHH